MCGIIGYVGHRRSQDILFAGLKRLEYRGYDSAGVAWREDGRTECVRAVGNLDSLDAALAARARRTRRRHRHGARDSIDRHRTHPLGDARSRHRVQRPSPRGRHRSFPDRAQRDHRELPPLRERLAADLIECSSDTDAEVVAQLIALNYDGDLADAVRRSLGDLTGHYALVAMCDDEPDTLVGVRHECPLVVGIGEGEHFIASSISAFLAHTRTVTALHDDEIVVLRPNEITVFDVDGLPHCPPSEEVDWDEESCEKDGFETFMLKEIHEQGAAVAETLSHWRATRATGSVGVLSDERLRAVSRIIVVGCGTSYHAGLAGRIAIERWARIPVDVEVASEFRYRDPIIAPGTMVLAITQSGETADTLAAMRLAKARGAAVLAVTNAVGSQATRDGDGVLFTRAGVEMGVAATKTFVAQVVMLYALALHLAALAGTMSAERCSELQSELELLPERIDQVVGSVDERTREVAERLAWSPFFLFLGRLSGLPVAMEGALKLKEISYVPTDAYAAGEMKHGPIAMLGPDTPVICVATEESVLPKLLSNLSEASARGARVLAVATEGCEEISDYAEHVFYVPRTDPLLAGRAWHRAVAAVRLSPGTGPRFERRSAAQPGQDRHGRIAP